MTTKQMILALSILVAVSTTAVQLTSAAKPNTETMTQSASSTNGQSKVTDTKPSPDKQGNGGKQNGMKPKNDKKPPANQNGRKSPTDATYGNIADNTPNAVIISGGFETDPEDHGRPVVLIAAALGVPTEVFREAFSGVTPAGTDSGGPTGEEAQKNKAALMKVLEPYGITNERLDEVSNYYRYNGSHGEIWTKTKATATAIITNGVVTGVTITNAGAGYSSNPTITINGPTGKISVKATLAYTKDFKTNGSISALTLGAIQPTPTGKPTVTGKSMVKTTATTKPTVKATAKPTATPASTNSDNTALSVVISGGFNTDQQDHGRPVVLIAAALGVPTEVFREAFSGVTPADQGSGGPTGEEAQKNKAALLKVLAPYGITNERLDEVSNYYRYNESQGQVWKRTQATATAVITNGVLTGVTITNAGSGYSSNPTITVTGPNGKVTAEATVKYTEDFKTNGSISAITINK